MASQVTKRGAKPPQMNMTPLIDVTFQLILFFMLVNNIIAEELPPMVVPSLSNPQTVKQDEDIVKMTVNLMSRHGPEAKRDQDRLTGDGLVGKVKIGSQDEWINTSEIGVDKLILDRITEKLKQYKAELKAQGKVLQVDLRADASLHFNSVRDVLVSVTGAEIAKVNLVAFLDPKEE